MCRDYFQILSCILVLILCRLYDFIRSHHWDVANSLIDHYISSFIYMLM